MDFTSRSEFQFLLRARARILYQTVSETTSGRGIAIGIKLPTHQYDLGFETSHQKSMSGPEVHVGVGNVLKVTTGSRFTYQCDLGFEFRFRWARNRPTYLLMRNVTSLLWLKWEFSVTQTSCVSHHTWRKQSSKCCMYITILSVTIYSNNLITFSILLNTKHSNFVVYIMRKG